MKKEKNTEVKNTPKPKTKKPSILCVTTQKEFTDEKAILKAYPNINPCDLSQVMRGVSKSAGGYVFVIKY